VGLTDAYDLAVLKIDRSAVPAVAELGDSARLKQGQAVIAIGSALGDFRNTVTGGIISAHNRQLGELRGLLQTDAPINRGNSGGPLINLQGEVVGINVMVVRGNSFAGATAEGLGFSIPANTVRRVVAQLIETGEVRVPYLGIFYEVLNPQMSMAHGLSVTEGVWLERVLPGTPAAQAGLRAGDVVLSFGGQAINDAYPLPELLLRYRVGDEVVINVLREGNNLEIPVKLGERPD
jgi:2-alkenal reductase